MRRLTQITGGVVIATLVSMTVLPFSANLNAVAATTTADSTAVTKASTELSVASASGMSVANEADGSSTATTSAEQTSSTKASSSASSASEKSKESSVATSTSTSTHSAKSRLALMRATSTDIAAGTLGTVAWTISNTGILTLSGGDFGDALIPYQTGTARSPWYDWANKITSINIIGPITASKSVDYSYLFTSLSSLKTVTGFDKIDFSNVTSTVLMFWNDAALTSIDIGNPNFSSMVSMSGMFSACSSLKSLDVSNWDMSHVQDIGTMFMNCTSLTTLDVSNWNVSHVTSFKSLFLGCRSIASLDLSNWDMSSSTSQSGMLQLMSGLKHIKLGKQTKIAAANLPTPATTSGKWMLSGTSKTYTPADLMASYDGSTMAGDYYWEQPMVITKYVDENGNALKPETVQYGTAGNSYTTAPLDIAGYTLQATPANASGTFTTAPITVTYVYAGKLSFDSVPTMFDFGTHVISATDMTYASSITGDLTVNNNSASGWQLSAQLTSGFTGTTTGAKLAATLYYQSADGTQTPIGTDASTNILTETTASKEPINVSSGWGNTDTSAGLKLKVAGGSARNDTYHATVNWDLAKTVANK